MGGTGVSVEVVLQGGLTPLDMVVAHQPIPWLLLLLDPVRCRPPIFYLGMGVNARHASFGKHQDQAQCHPHLHPLLPHHRDP